MREKDDISHWMVSELSESVVILLHSICGRLYMVCGVRRMVCGSGRV